MSAIDRIARLYGRAVAVERVARRYQKDVYDTDLARDFKVLRKDARALGESIFLLGLVKDHVVTREQMPYIALPEAECRERVQVLENRLSDLLTVLVMAPVSKRTGLVVKRQEETMWQKEEAKEEVTP